MIWPLRSGEAPFLPRAGDRPAIKRKVLWAEWGLLGLVSTLAVIALVLNQATLRLDDALYDVVIGLKGRAPSPAIVLVAIDDASLARQGRWPWPRTLDAALIRAIAAGRPRVIACDMLFAEPGPLAGDLALRRATQGARLFLPVLLTAPQANGHAGQVTAPIPMLASAVAGVGHADTDYDVDGIVRRAFLYEGNSQHLWPHLMVAAAGLVDRRWVTRTRRAPVNGVARGLVRLDEILIPYAGPAGTFRPVSASSVIAGETPAAVFKDKIVLVGATAPGLLDDYPTPFSRSGTMSNIEVEANILDGLITHREIRPAPRLVVLAISLAAVWSLLIGLVRLPPRANLFLGVGLGIAVVGGAVLALALFNLWAPPVACAATMAFILPLWGWRRLQAASSYFESELLALQQEAGIPILANRRVDRGGGDVVLRQMTLLEETNRRFRALRRLIADSMAQFPDPVLVTDLEGRILMANQVAIALGDRLGAAATRAAPVQAILARLNGGSGRGEAFWPPPLAGGRALARLAQAPGGRSFEVRYSQTHNARGAVSGWIVQMADVSDLLSAVRQREEALQLFTHDMRSPQVAILALLDHPDFEVAPAAMRQRIADAAQRTLGLANSFVRLAQAESAPLTLESIDMGHLVGDAADALWAPAHAAGVTIAVHADETEYVVRVDRNLITRALINLIDNAVKFSPIGGSVTCTLRADTLHGRPAVACAIADCGPGMPEIQVAGLYRRFAHVPSPIGPPKIDGVGLGLALVDAATLRHDGAIRCDSPPGEGTVFTVVLPLEPGAEVP